MKKDSHITLNFSEVFLARLRDYATRHDMKVNAVVKQAFELLEDREANKAAQGVPNDFDY